MTPRHIQETAFQLVADHGDTAPIHAAMEADACLDQGDLDGAAHWRRVIRAIEGMMEGARH